MLVAAGACGHLQSVCSAKLLLGSEGSSTATFEKAQAKTPVPEGSMLPPFQAVEGVINGVTLTKWKDTYLCSSGSGTQTSSESS